MKRDGPRDRDGDGQQRRGNRTLDEDARRVHAGSACGRPGDRGSRPCSRRCANRAPKVVEEDVDDRRRVEREHLAEQSGRRPSPRRAACAAPSRCPVPNASGNAAEQRRHRGHHNRPEAQQRRLIDGFRGALALFALGFESEVDHHDAVLLHDADEKNDADDGDDVEIQCEQLAARAARRRPPRAVWKEW